MWITIDFLRLLQDVVACLWSETCGATDSHWFDHVDQWIYQTKISIRANNDQSLCIDESSDHFFFVLISSQRNRTKNKNSEFTWLYLFISYLSVSDTWRMSGKGKETKKAKRPPGAGNDFFKSVRMTLKFSNRFDFILFLFLVGDRDSQFRWSKCNGNGRWWRWRLWSTTQSVRRGHS